MGLSSYFKAEDEIVPVNDVDMQGVGNIAVLLTDCCDYSVYRAQIDIAGYAKSYDIIPSPLLLAHINLSWPWGGHIYPLPNLKRRGA